MLFSKRKKLADEYETWVKKPLEDGSKIKDCAFSVITFMVSKGFVKVPKDSIVITKAKYEELLARPLNVMGDLVISKIKNKCKYNKDDICVNADSEYLADYCPIDKDSVVITKEEFEKLKTQLKIKTNEAEWRADQLQALDKDFELLKKVVKCKDCKWLEEKHYEKDNEKPYIKLVCKLTKRQCRLYDFCSYGESKV